MIQILKHTALFAGSVLLSGLALAQEAQTLVHKTTGATCSNNVSLVSNPLMDNKPSGIFLFTHNYSAKGVTGMRYDEKQGLYYSGTKWYLYNQDKSPMDTGLAYNILVPGLGLKSWIFTADSNNSFANVALLDHGAINGDSNAMIFVNDVWNLNGAAKGVYNTNTIGIYYNHAAKKWGVFHQDFKVDMIPGSSFNVMMVENSSSITRFVHTAKKSNVVLNYTLLDHPDANNNPDAQIFITQNWNPNYKTGVYNDHEVGVYYTGTKWAIYNEDAMKMDTNISFNVMIFPNKTANTKNYEMNNAVNIFPNPVNNGENLEIQVQHPGMGQMTLCIMDMSGKKLITRIFDKKANTWNETLPISGMAKGVYILQVNGNNFHSIKRFVIE